MDITIPAAMFIEMAVDMLKSPETISDEYRAAQRKELAFADPRGNDSNFADGYELGLQTARALLCGMPAAVKAGVKI